MFAVVKTGGKQIMCKLGDVIQVEKLEGAKGSDMTFTEVLLVSQASGETLVGSPLVAQASVTGQVVGQGRDEKILIVKMKRRKQYRRTQGHRQEQTQILITGISAGALQGTLSASEITEKSKKFFSNLKPKTAPRKANDPVVAQA